MNSEIYPAFSIQNVSLNVTKGELIKIILDRLGPNPNDYIDKNFKVQIYSPTYWDALSTTAVVTGIRKPFGEIRRNLNKIKLDGKLLRVADMDFGLERNKDSTLDSRNIIVQEQLKKEYGQLGIINVFDRKWLRDNLGGMKKFDCLAVLEHPDNAPEVERIEAKNLIWAGKVPFEKTVEVGLEPGQENLALEFSTPLDAVQAICLHNKSLILGGRCFLGKKGKPVQIQNGWLGISGEIDVDALTNEYGYIPFSAFRQEVLNPRIINQIKLPCLTCGNEMRILGVHPSLSFLAADCQCFNLDKSPLFFAWQEERFLRVFPTNPATYVIQKAKPQYNSVHECKEIMLRTACLRQLQVNLDYFQHHQVAGVVTSVIQKEKYRGRLPVMVKVEVDQGTAIWTGWGPLQMDQVTIVINPQAKQGVNGKWRCEFREVDGEIRTTGRVTAINSLPNGKVQPEIFCFLPLDFPIAEQEQVYLIPRSPTHSVEALRDFIWIWENHRRQIEIPPQFMQGDLIGVFPVSDSNPFAGQQSSFLMHAQVSRLQILEALQERLEQDYLGAEVDIEVENPQNGFKTQAFLINAEILDILPKGEKCQLSLLVKVEKPMRPSVGSIFFSLWSISQIRNMPYGFRSNYFGNGPLFGVIKKETSKEEKWNYVREYVSFNGACIQNDYQAIVQRPMQLQSPSIMDIFLKKKSSVDHSCFVELLNRIENTSFNSVMNEIRGKLDMYQMQAIDRAVKERLSIVVGPQGSGKTFNLVLLSIFLALQEPGVLMVACPNPTSAKQVCQAIRREKNLLGLQQQLRVHSIYDYYWKKRTVLDSSLYRAVKYGPSNLRTREEESWIIKEKEMEQALMQKAQIFCFSLDGGYDYKLAALAERVKQKGGYVSAVIIDDFHEISQSDLIRAMGGVSPERLILFGDDGFLPNTSCDSTSPPSPELNIFELIKLTNYFQVHQPVVKLKNQYRMHPQIFQTFSDLKDPSERTKVRDITNRTQLINYDSLYNFLPDLRGNQIGYYCFQRRANLSENVDKACIIASALIKKIELGGLDEIGLICTNENVEKACSGEITFQKVNVGTPHDFQGKERSAIILILTDVNTCSSQLEMAISRAKNVLFVIAIDDLYSTAESVQVRNFFKKLKDQFSVTHFD